MLGRSLAAAALALAACRFDSHGVASSGSAPDAALAIDGRAAPGEDAAVDADPGHAEHPRLRALPGRLTIDGDLADVGDKGWQYLAAPGDFVSTGGTASGPSDLAARVAARWTADRLYLAVAVTDDVFHNEQDGPEIWRSDSVQAAFDLGRDGATTYDTVDDFEYGWARHTTGIWEHRWVAPVGAPAFAVDEFMVARVGTETRYEVSLSPAALGLDAFTANLEVGLSLVVNDDDDDGVGRSGYLEWSSGVGTTKDPSRFGTLRLQNGGGD